MSTDLREHLDRLDTALAAATPGPWEHIVDDHGRKGIEHSIWSSEEGGIDGSYISEQVEDAADAALIVAAVNALPGLLAAVRAAADLLDAADERTRRVLPPSAAEHLVAEGAHTVRVSDLRTALAAALPEGETP